jgi:hypothetical protein
MLFIEKVFDVHRLDFLNLIYSKDLLFFCIPIGLLIKEINVLKILKFYFQLFSQMALFQTIRVRYDFSLLSFTLNIGCIFLIVIESLYHYYSTGSHALLKLEVSDVFISCLLCLSHDHLFH